VLLDVRQQFSNSTVTSAEKEATVPSTKVPRTETSNVSRTNAATHGLGECNKLGVCGEALVHNEFWCIWGLINASCMQQFSIFVTF